MKQLIVFATITLFATSMFGHCDWINGPVVGSAREALESATVTPVLRWIQPTDEQEIGEGFARALKVRAAGPEARALADRWFFELVVRIHRRGEGETFEGLKGTEYTPEEGIRLAEKAIDAQSLDDTEKMLMGELSGVLRRRFAEVMAAKKNADSSVEAGRLYVQKYADFIHYAESLHRAATSAAHAEAHAAERHP